MSSLVRVFLNAIVAVVFVASIASVALGDVLPNPAGARRRPAPSGTAARPATNEGKTQLSVYETDQDGSRLVIPRKVLSQLGSPPPANQEHKLTGTGSGLRNVGGGLLLAFLITGGGLVVAAVRQRKSVRVATALVAGAIFSVAIGFAIAVTVAAAPEPAATPDADHNAADNPVQKMMVKVEVAETGDDIKMFLGKDALPPAPAPPPPKAAPAPPAPPAPVPTPLAPAPEAAAKP